MTEDQIVETGARALSHASNPRQNWDFRPRHEQEFYRIEAREFLTALRSAGLAIVPVEPTEAQLKAFDAACDDSGMCLVKYGYKAMIAAATED